MGIFYSMELVLYYFIHMNIVWIFFIVLTYIILLHLFFIHEKLINMLTAIWLLAVMYNFQI